MNNMLHWLNNNFNSVLPTKPLARKAVRHLKKKEKKQLFSPEISEMRAAEGRWYESLIYEVVLELAKDNQIIKWVIRKGADAPFPPIDVVLGQNGFYYSNRGDINIRGNGQDIAEVDLLIVDSDDQVCFCEVVTSASDLKELEEEVHYKKRLLGYLFGQAIVPFILFSSVDISRSSIMKRLVKETESVLIVTKSCEELKSFLKSSATKGVPRKPIRHSKHLSLEHLQPRRPFDYKKVHDLRRDRVIEKMMAGKDLNELGSRDEIPPITKKVLFGALQPSGINALMKDRDVVIKDKKYTPEKVMKDFSKVIIAVDLPSFEPVIYVRLCNRKEYLKVVPKKSGGFRVESKRTPRMTGFFLWLESMKPSVEASLAGKYREQFMPAVNVKGSKKKPCKNPVARCHKDKPDSSHE